LQLALIADHADDRPQFPLAQVRAKTQLLNVLQDMIQLRLRRMRLKDNDH